MMRTSIVNNTSTFRSFNFHAQVKYVPLLHSLPNHTAINHEWPPAKLRKTLPSYISAALIDSPPHQTDHEINVNDSDMPFIGPAIHVQTGDILSVTLRNSLPTTGLSLHWHGFEMTNSLEYDGVVGVTQCPISPYTQFVYEFAVDETPGTYWWHTHSLCNLHLLYTNSSLLMYYHGFVLNNRACSIHKGVLGEHAINSIHGPLIVHSKGEEKKQLVDKLNGAKSEDTGTGNINTLYYENERILFFKDGYIHPDAIEFQKKMGGLNEAVSKDDAGYTVGTSAWEYGTCNGRLREIVPVLPGQTYTFRLINGGVHYGLRINIADLKMKVIAADSEPVEPIVVNEVFLHAAERFDVEVTIPNDWLEGQSFWIRADTAESGYQGYQNGVRAILSIQTQIESLFSQSTEVIDPQDNIESPIVQSKDHLTMNCFERKSFEGVPYKGRCLPITKLSQSLSNAERQMELHREENVEVHFIDSHFQPYPQHSHFIRFDDGQFYQHVNPIKSMLDPSFGLADLHPNTAVLHVQAFSTVVLVWRTTSLMDHPMHLHGLKMEILDIALPSKQEDCTLSKCKLNDFYGTNANVQALARSIPPNSAVLKDTFIVPAGGAVVTRIHTQDPSLWYSHCHLEMHHFDGMAFILNVGNHSGFSRKLPNDYPSCDSPYLQSLTQYPSCDCYENPNTVLSNYLTSEYKYSRDHLCHHVHSRAANLDRYQLAGGDDIHSSYAIPGWGISLIVVFLTCFILTATRQILWWIGSVNDNKRDVKQQYHGTARPSPESSLVLALSESRRSEMPTNSDDSDDHGAQIARIDPAKMSGDKVMILREDILVQTADPVAQQISIDSDDEEGSSGREFEQSESYSTYQAPEKSDEKITDASPFGEQLKHVLLTQYRNYRPVCVNGLRVFEVCSLGILTGFLFYDVGNKSSFVGLSQRLSLYFFSTTLWTFTRMYPSVGFSHQWAMSCAIDLKQKRFSLGPVVLGRLIVVYGLESLWPLIYVFVCYPFASVFGSIKIVIMVGLFLLLNNLCYISLGSVLGVYSKRVPLGMIASTIFSQTSLVAAGFYTQLPPALDWIRYVSPFYWSFRGILKSCFKWNDTLECFKGSSEVGANQCYLEYHAAIDQYKERGINVATYNDSSSTTVYLEYMCLLLLLLFMNFLILLKAWSIRRQTA